MKSKPPATTYGTFNYLTPIQEQARGIQGLKLPQRNSQVPVGMNRRQTLPYKIHAKKMNLIRKLPDRFSWVQQKAPARGA